MLNVRIASPSDGTEVARVYNQAITSDSISAGHIQPVSAEDRENWIRSHKTPYDVFVLDSPTGGIVGFSYLSPFTFRPNLSHVTEIAVFLDVTAKGKLNGAKLFMHAIEYAKKMGFRHVVNLVFSANTVSIRSTERVFGKMVLEFQDIALVRDKFESVTVFQKNLMKENLDEKSMAFVKRLVGDL